MRRPPLAIRVLGAAACLALLSTGCGRRQVTVPLPGGQDLKVARSEINGIASWYGDPFHGRRTSNGEVYDMHRMTAAHRTLPFDTVVRVNNLDNGKRVQVRINDRGPFVKGRIIDLSYAAAQKVDMVGPGTAKVRLDVLRIEASTAVLAVQVGSFRKEARARSLKKTLQRNYSPVKISRYQSPQGPFYRVLVGSHSSRHKAMKTLRRLRSKGYQGFLIRLD